MVVARAILGEWLGGSGGGWQDSGGIFPGIKLIEGVAAAEGDPEWGVSRGRLLPAHQSAERARPRPPASRQRRRASKPFPEALARSLVLVHGGMAQNVGPILNMVTAKYLLRGRDEWLARLESPRDLRRDPRGRRLCRTSAASGSWTTRNWDGPLKRDHPLGHQRVHRVDHPRGPRRCWATTSGGS